MRPLLPCICAEELGGAILFQAERRVGGGHAGRGGWRFVRLWTEGVWDEPFLPACRGACPGRPPCPYARPVLRVWHRRNHPYVCVAAASHGRLAVVDMIHASAVLCAGQRRRRLPFRHSDAAASHVSSVACALAIRVRRSSLPRAKALAVERAATGSSGSALWEASER